MSGNLDKIKAKQNSKKKQRGAICSALNARKLKAIRDINPFTPSPIMQSITVCFPCGSNDGLEVNYLCTSNLKPVS